MSTGVKKEREVEGPWCQEDGSVCVCVYVCNCAQKYSNASTEARRSELMNKFVYVFGLPSASQQRPCELFSRSLATLIMSGPPHTINQPRAVPLNPQTGAQSNKNVCLAETELFRALSLQWISAMNAVIPVISGISGSITRDKIRQNV